MDIALDGAAVRFGEFQAVHPTDLTIRASEFFSILGPSGCGKTTILRLLSGFLDPSEGEVRIGGQPMAGIGPSDRPTALIFQNLALFPLMSVWENVAFGLEMRGWKKAQRRDKAHELLRMVALDGQADKLPGELSGGQRQRVAIARALAVEPAVLLLDEPLSALDLKLRQHMRAELKQLQKATGITFVYITHDQGEALTMSDRVAVMNRGWIVQVGSADDVYHRPETAFVATFVGETNRLPGRIETASDGKARIATPEGAFVAENPAGLSSGAEAILFLRPERLHLLAGRETPANTLTGKLVRRDMEGAFSTLVVETGAGQLTVQRVNAGTDPLPDGPLHLGFSDSAGVILPPGDTADD
ncbi:spermidine/putrescine transport system ATP-binding protein [Rhodovulum euryhalinum]|uniref:Spermidine/putrescine transport system ATP-binding protein n=2 Tax=Rhodovulum euryhalinum TaxID=35805 RepID=A0A4R2KNK2_9RHOB|nr:spermidine/putrescine transport system ATP-binding protein [Rhodovulum euryhalinum]